MIRKLYNKLWVKPQLAVFAFVQGSNPNEDEVFVCNTIFTLIGALCVILGIAYILVAEAAYYLACRKFSDLGGQQDDEDEDKVFVGLRYILDNYGKKEIFLSAVDKYFYIKIYLKTAKTFNRDDEDRINDAEKMLQEYYEEALVLGLAEVE
jgi:hypothetical protein